MNKEAAEAVMLLVCLFAGYPIATFIRPKRLMRLLLSGVIGVVLYFGLKGFIFPFL